MMDQLRLMRVKEAVTKVNMRMVRKSHSLRVSFDYLRISHLNFLLLTRYEMQTVFEYFSVIFVVFGYLSFNFQLNSINWWCSKQSIQGFSATSTDAQGLKLPGLAYFLQNSRTFQDIVNPKLYKVFVRPVYISICLFLCLCLFFCRQL